MELPIRLPVLLLLVLFLYQCRGQNNTSPSLGFDCRRGQSETPTCQNSGTCVLDTGECQCNKSTVALPNYLCQDTTPTADCTPGCVNGQCHNRVCVCNEDFYGPTCDTPRLLILCRNEKMLVSINPSQNQNFSDLIKKEDGSCPFTKYGNSSAVDLDFDDEINQRYPDLGGWYRIFEIKQSPCSANSDNATTGEPSFSVKNIYIQYNSMYKSAVDQLVEARCYLSNNVTQVNGNVSDIDSSSGDIDHVKGDGKVDVVSLRVTRKDGTAISGKVRLGEEIHLNFTLTKGTSESFQLSECAANNTKETQGFQSVVFIRDGCPLQNASALFAGLTIKEDSKDKLSRTVLLKVFKFVDSTSIGFSCRVTICGATNSDKCKDPVCTGFSGTTNSNTGGSGNNPGNGTDNSSGNSTSGGANNPVAPANSTSGSTNNPVAPANSTSGAGGVAPAAQVRKRRDADNTKSANVGATVDLDGADDSSSAIWPPSTSACMQKPDITAVVIVLAVCVFLLLLLTALLLYRLLASNPKTGSNSRPEGSTRPVETLRFPRLELASSTYNNSL